MKKKISSITLTALALTGGLGMVAGFAAELNAGLQKESQEAIGEFLKTDPALQKFITNSAGYVIFPNVGKGGFIVGGAHGKGLVYDKTGVIGEATMTQASIGAQVGGQTFAEIIFFEKPAALDDFKAGKWEMAAEVSGVVAAEGVAQAANYKQGLAVFTLPKKGLMGQAAVGGQKFKYEPISPPAK